MVVWVHAEEMSPERRMIIREFYSNSMSLYVAQFNCLLAVVNFFTCHINAFAIYRQESLLLRSNDLPTMMAMG